MARKKRTKKQPEAEQLSLYFDPREKDLKLEKNGERNLTLQDVTEIVEYYLYYGEFASVEMGQTDLINLGKECLRLRELLERIEKSDNIEEIRILAKRGLNESKRYS